jgi:transposase-like protein
VSSSTHLPCFSGKPQNVVSTEEKNEIHENSLVQRSKSDRMWKKHRGMSHRNSKLIVKAHRTLISWDEFLCWKKEKKGLNFNVTC